MLLMAPPKEFWELLFIKNTHSEKITLFHNNPENRSNQKVYFQTACRFCALLWHFEPSLTGVLLKASYQNGLRALITGNGDIC
jgi:hypothetical protein